MVFDVFLHINQSPGFSQSPENIARKAADKASAWTG
jgi:hypothetical protein